MGGTWYGIRFMEPKERVKIMATGVVVNSYGANPLSGAHRPWCDRFKRHVDRITITRRWGGMRAFCGECRPFVAIPSAADGARDDGGGAG